MRSSPAVEDDLSQQESVWGMLEAEMEDAGGGWGLHLLESGIPLTWETRAKYGLVLSF